MIKIHGASLHNLKNVHAEFPKGKITVVCGPSGCGKSTLVLDTLHGECKRRYLETISPFAVELLGGKRTIPLEYAEGLLASIAIGPSRGEAPAKSYALSLAECDNDLRTLFAFFAKPVCPICGQNMEKTSREILIDTIANYPEGTKMQFLARIETGKKTLDKLAALFLSQGFTRALADGVSFSLADLTTEEKNIIPEEFYIVIDRIIIRQNTRTRIAESIDSTLALTHTKITLFIENKYTHFSLVPECPNAHDKEHQKSEYLEAKSLVFSSALFNPYTKNSACPHCNGVGCDDCENLRLKDVILNSQVNGISWRKLLLTPFKNLPETLEFLFDKKIPEHLKSTYKNLRERIDAVVELGVGYLTLGRSGPTLSGGEMQRLKLASLSTGHLNGLLICLDEPASGLHAHDVEKLWAVLTKIKKRNNTLVLIEHNPLIIEKADYIIEMGPGAGALGGEILFAGFRDDILHNENSPTSNWLKNLKKNTSPKKNIQAQKNIQVSNFKRYDIQPINAEFPVEKFSVISGESGSGKSTLLFENIVPRFESNEFLPLGIEALCVLSTGDFHGSKRSTIASALGFNTLLKDLFQKLPESKLRGYNGNKFSTHAPGGRCENCKGEGVLHDAMGFEEWTCPVCLGSRFKDEILEIRFKSLSIADILNLSIQEAYQVFYDLKPFKDKLKPLLETGLDYLKLGQTTNHLSGGERARLRLSIALSKAKTPHTLFLFDEPARGLHQKDIALLIALIKKLTAKGHTVIAIEHSKDFIISGDKVIELSRKEM